MALETQPLHFLLIPLMAQGHMIPMIDLAKLIAKQGVVVTIVTTPLNALRLKATIDHAIKTGLQIRVCQLKFEPKESGLPERCENIDMLPSVSLIKDFMIAICKLQKPLEQVFNELNPRPCCIISDAAFHWTLDVARKFNIPRIVFHGTCSFALLCSYNLRKTRVHEKVTSETGIFVVPGLPDKIELTKGQLPGSLSHRPSNLDDIRARSIAAEEESFGVVLNTFEELEPLYIRRYKEAKGKKKVWCIGPVSLCNKDSVDKGVRGNSASIEQSRCLEWLDLCEVGSVVFACLGSLCNLTVSQTKELGLGLEASNRPFIWVIRGGRNLEELEKWIEVDGFEERTRGRGLVIRGWAPQVLILSHPATGGFVTHCGWNSTLEGICAGLPMVTYPMFAEQFLNEKLVVEVLRVGVKVGTKGSVWGEEEKSDVVVKKEDVKNAVDILMDIDGEEGKTRRERARKLGGMAKVALEGGSSEANMMSLIQEMMQQVNTGGRFGVI